MGFLMLLVFLNFWCISPRTATAADFDVTTYGAYGDGMTDDSQAVQAWADLCGDTSEYPTMIIPPKLTFLLSPVVFDGSSCVAPAVNIKSKIKGDSSHDQLYILRKMLSLGFAEGDFRTDTRRQQVFNKSSADEETSSAGCMLT